MSMSHDEYIDLSVDNIDGTKDIEFDTYNDEIRINLVLKTHLDDGDKLVWYKDPTIVATWHSNGRLDIFDKQNVSICDANFRILKGHWRTKDEHGVGTESNHWLFDDKPISEYLELFPEFWKANEVKEEQPKKERKPRQKKEVSEKTADAILSSQEDTVKEYKYKSEKYLYDSNYSDTYPDTLRKQATPSWVAEDMVDLLPDEVWRTDSKFLDIYCKSGIFLEIIIDRLMNKVDYSSIGFTSDREIRQYIIENQVYAICWNKWYLDLSRKAINGKSSMIGNIYCIGPEVENMTEDEAKAVLEDARAQNSIDKTILGLDIRKEFFGSMKIDAVVGNPPYNNDIYLDFVEKSFELSSNITCMITPAKWQAKGGTKNEAFRKNIVPHMSKVVYYPDAGDIFNIAEHSGISYYLISNDIYDSKEIKNVCVFQPLYNDCEQRSIFNATLCNKGAHLVDKILKKELNIERLNKSRRYKVWCANKLSLGRAINGIPHPFSKDGDLLCLGIQQVEDSETNKIVYEPIPSRRGGIADDSRVIFSSESLDECKYFISFCYTRTVRYLLSLSLCGVTGIATGNEWWRFVPDPGAFDRIFVDRPDPITQPNAQPDDNGNYEYNGQKYCSLYKKYNLTEEEINIIESVIKERK